MAHFTVAIQREFFFLFLLDKNVSLNFVIFHKVEETKENQETTKEVVSLNKFEKMNGSYARNQWIQSNGKWYYVLSNGKMAKNTVIDGYQLNENGKWV